MINLTKTGLILFFTVMVTCAFAESALTLNEAKSQGLVGEDIGGYLAPVNATTSAVEQLVNSVNQLRRAEYQRIARAHEINLADVEALAGRKAIEKSVSGSFIRLTGSTWIRKPSIPPE
jgi:uncharacterized protein YdbL (DUF1318 family)